jgi:peroxiredoxin
MRKLLRHGLLIFVLGLLGFFGFKIGSKIGEKKKVAEVLETLPDFSFQTLDGVEFTNNSLIRNQYSVLIYFNSECNFCQHEAQSISDNLEKFKDVEFLFVSTESSGTIQQFSQQYNLDNKKTITFLHDYLDTFSSRFDATSIPYLLIYNKEGQLIKRHKGQLNAGGILKAIQLDGENN